ncbi:DUF998 domain-containing protein [Flavobacterium sp.]|uniref:DUF998 domain-containing protein n=1 Tax=Flavobacterium sp. TaxID=239 RepID=UPI0037533CD2
MKDTPELISYKLLRKIVGFIGFLLPLVLLFGDNKKINNECPKSSVSFYYHTNMGDVFVGLLCAVALFLFTYKGHKKEKSDWLSDNQAGNLAAIFAFVVAFSPCTFIEGTKTPNGTIHNIAASLFFLILAYFCLKLFTKTSGDSTQMKIFRNKIYKTCGFIILFSIAMLAIYLFKSIENYFRDTIYFWFWEVVALWVFAFSWLVKGEIFFKDK